DLKLSGVAISAGTVVTAADIANLTFAPAENANGNGYASFTFSVNDGDVFDPTANTLTINVTPVNDAPTRLEPPALNFIQGVEDLYSGTYVRAISPIEGGGLFIMDAKTGGWVREFSGAAIYTVSFEAADTIVGIGGDELGTYLYRANIATNSFSMLGRAPELEPTGIWRQGDYAYDGVAQKLYIGGAAGSLSDFENSIPGVHAYGFDASLSYSFQALDPSYYVTVVNGSPVGLLPEGQFSLPQGQSAFNASTQTFYAACLWNLDYGVPGDSGENTKFGIVKYEFIEDHFEYRAFIELGYENFISNIAYDAEADLFLAERDNGSSIELVTLNFFEDTVTFGAAVSAAARATDLAVGTEDIAYTVAAADLLVGFSDVDVGDTLSVANLSASSGMIVDNGDGTFTITPTENFNGLVTLTYDVIDGNGGSVIGQTLSYRLAAVNDAPTVANLIPNQPATEDTAFSFQFAADTFADVDVGDTLTYAATLADGSALPSWLSFDPSTRTFSGTPLNEDVGTISIKVTATDGSGEPISDTFDLAVGNTNDAPT
ncbi:MAG: cadherin-like domain-containing protein, partial [Thermomicrobiales bacterium]